MALKLVLALGLMAVLAKAQSNDLVVAVIGDWGLVGDEHQKEVAAAMDDWVGESGATAVLGMGDNFYSDGVVSVDDPQFDLAWRDVYLTLPNLKDKIWYITLGNKDQDGNVFAQIEFGQREPLWYLPNLYHTWTMNAGDQTVQFISLHTKIIDEDPGQVEWFIRTITESTADWVILCIHHPIYSAGKNGNRNRSKWIIENIKPYVDQYKVGLVLQGHDHNLQHIYNPNEATQYVTSGAGHDLNPQDDDATEFVEEELGGVIEYFGKDYGFVGLKISGDVATVSYYTRDGILDHEFTQVNPRNARK